MNALATFQPVQITNPSPLMTRSFMSIFGRILMSQPIEDMYLTKVLPVERLGCVHLVEVFAARPTREEYHDIRPALLEDRPQTTGLYFDPPVAIPLMLDDRQIRIGLHRVAVALANDLQYQMTASRTKALGHLEKARQALRDAIAIIPTMTSLTKTERAYLDMQWGFWLSQTGKIDIMEA